MIQTMFRFNTEKPPSPHIAFSHHDVILYALYPKQVHCIEYLTMSAVFRDDVKC